MEAGKQKAYTVSQVNQYIKNMFLSDFALNHIYIKGEVSNCKYHSSGHIYFTLKDAKSQMACVMFAGQRSGLSFRLEEGQDVIAMGNVSVYERDGKYQLYASHIVLDGMGMLYEKFEQLKQKLLKEGLFLEEHKKQIPTFSKKIGVVTASTGAAIQDIINITARRNPYVQLILFPAKVQGEGAAETIVEGIKRLDSYGVDVIIVGRGGGSIEDLWAFNEEMVARAIYQCKTPVVSAVGHETDTTIADYVSDLRAPTPSAAAELTVCNIQDLLDTIEEMGRSLNRGLERKIKEYRSTVERQRLRLSYQSPVYQIQQNRQYLQDVEDKMRQYMNFLIQRKRHMLQLYVERMKGVSPLDKLSSGYAFVSGEDNKPVKEASAVREGEILCISFADGDIFATVGKTVNRRRN
ncbi:exodeoxyribonuclease VII large subunit [Anaeromicropila populeti]|uniref:Exodeoxyribonuclease 7 large subunit n=1 Tax=Anaeromicropila populeti TaxID=37658 RepID=A0A1I6ILB0_9FIRM|nr:exodeoxyribonuclease VII large subunit [Anaeromicropila populeti]SFR67508.1 Exodeoxyribonuclease VII large subunit [Anaeromicropila populeti]